MQPCFGILQAWMDKYFARILSLSSNEELPPRIRFMLLDVTDLRKGNVSNMHILDVCRICITQYGSTVYIGIAMVYPH